MKIVRSSDVVIKNLLDLIMKGEIGPGDKLPSIEHLAKQMGTSIISAREAVQNLAAIGLIEISHGRGTFMTEGAPVMEELFEARKVVESYSAMAAAARAPEPESLAYMERLLDEMNEAIKDKEIERYSELDYEFHLAIGKAAGNRILFKTLENIKGLLRYQQFTINRLPNIIKISLQRHKEIFEAIKARNPQTAEASMTLHITEVIDSWKKRVSPLQSKR
jgi:GntR family transcriptional regulator, transcriptional repressor for pyruvate dehydrogenase complex